MSLFGPTLGSPTLSSPSFSSDFSRDFDSPWAYELVLPVQLISEVDVTPDGALVEAVSKSWFHIFEALHIKPELLYEFATNPRNFEEFIAATYKQDGWDEVILTPRSGDKGRDVIAIKKGFGSIRFLEQTKAYSKGHLVTHDEVSAMLGVLQTDTNSSKVLVTTTSDFQPEILSGDRFKALMPHRLELKNGNQLLKWLDDIAKRDKR